MSWSRTCFSPLTQGSPEVDPQPLLTTAVLLSLLEPLISVSICKPAEAASQENRLAKLKASDGAISELDSSVTVITGMELTIAKSSWKEGLVSEGANSMLL